MEGEEDDLLSDLLGLCLGDEPSSPKGPAVETAAVLRHFWVSGGQQLVGTIATTGATAAALVTPLQTPAEGAATLPAAPDQRNGEARQGTDAAAPAAAAAAASGATAADSGPQGLKTQLRERLKTAAVGLVHDDAVAFKVRTWWWHLGCMYVGAARWLPPKQSGGQSSSSDVWVRGGNGGGALDLQVLGPPLSIICVAACLLGDHLLPSPTAALPLPCPPCPITAQVADELLGYLGSDQVASLLDRPNSAQRLEGRILGHALAQLAARGDLDPPKAVAEALKHAVQSAGSSSDGGGGGGGSPVGLDEEQMRELGMSLYLQAATLVSVGGAAAGFWCCVRTYEVLH